MQSRSWKIIIKAVFLVPAFLWGSSASAENVRVSYASLSTSYMDHVVAMERGYFREEGLNIEIVRAGGGAATPALLSGQLHFSTSASSAVSAALRGGPLKIVYTNLSSFTYKLVSNKPEIKTIKDLVGKKVAIATFGDTFHLSTLLLLKKHGIPPSSVLLIAVGKVEARFAAFKVGSVDATPLAPRDILALGQIGGHVLADISKDIQLVGNGVAVSNKLLAENPLLVERFLRAVVKGREYARRYKEQTVAMVTKFDPTPREAIASEYEATVLNMTEEGWLAPEVLKEEVVTRAELIKLAQPPDASKLFDYSMVRKIYGELKASGWKPNP
ncbi:MAG: ABC transporter substrate-binding protein [Deltaproteobacteria bacterium]|nr:ABC transporter substrate-binding protein [Deltaproteobacteria bacterium]